jgi:U4/U6.U5 tri-snRNP-associated protein 3
LHCRERRRDRKRKEKEDKKNSKDDKPADLMAGLTAEEIMQMQQLGLPFGFGTTQGIEVEDAAANESAMKVSSQRKARQFMNRKGGFNRMLPPEQTGKKMQEA